MSERITAIPLPEFLDTDDPDVTYRIADLLPVGGRALWAAQYKGGKTTGVHNLTRCLADGNAFLDRFPVQAARVTLIDDEMDQRQLRRWLRSQQILNPHRVRVVPLRGSLGTFDIIRPEVRAQWADALRGTEVLIFDCLRPVLDALGLDENRDAGRFLVAFDALLKEAGIDEAVVVHHMGHAGERSRGDSRLRDWPDVEWRLVRGSEEPHSPRFFSAYGRDVDVPEFSLSYDADTRRLSAGEGSRVDADVDAAIIDIVGTITASGTSGLSRNRIEVALKNEHPQKLIRRALDAALARSEITESIGPRGARICHLGTAQTRPRQTSSSPRQRSPHDLVSSSIERRGEVVRAEGATSSTTNCTACGFRLDPVIVAEGFTVHPGKCAEPEPDQQVQQARSSRQEDLHCRHGHADDGSCYECFASAFGRLA